MNIANLSLSAVIASAIVLSGCASRPISSGDEIHVRCRTARPLTCDRIKSTGVHDTNGHVRCRTAKPLTCDHVRPEDAHGMSGPSFTSHPWFKDKPWLGKIMARSNQSTPDDHNAALEVERHTKRVRPGYPSWYKDKPWLGKILYRSSELAPDQHEEQLEGKGDTGRPSPINHPWFKDKPWLGKILLPND